MADFIHINAARKMLDSGEPVDIVLWTKSGEIQHWRNCVSLKSSRRSGTRQIKLLDSRAIRTLRDVCIYQINSLTLTL